MSTVADLYAALTGPSPSARAAETAGTAGTAGDGYMVTPRPHQFVSQPPEPGCRPLCAVCGSEKSTPHLPSPRSPR